MSLLRKIKTYLGLYPLFEEKNKDDNFYEFILDKNKVKNEVCSYGFNFISCYPFDAVKGIKDEIIF